MVWKDISELEIYQLGLKIGDVTYQMISHWGNFEKNTIGYQLIRAVDSIPANISEGYGRYYFKDQRRFCYIARGSIYEVRTWLNKARSRIPDDEKKINEIIILINTLHKKLNAYIKYLETRLE
jgi:four helix bundle protein